MDYDFLARLRNGESVEDIANELTKSLNDANKQHVQEQNKQPVKDKYDYAIELLEALEGLLREYGQDNVADAVNEMEAEEVLDMMEKIVPLLNLLQQYQELTHKQDQENRATEKDPLGDFLDKFVN